MKSISIIRLVVVSASVACPLGAAPQWIWLQKQGKDEEKVTFKRMITINQPLNSAKLNFTCDNGATVFLNGKKVEKNENWDKPTRADLTSLMKPGENELHFDATNSNGPAGLVFSLKLTDEKGKIVVIESDASWMAAVTGSSDFKPAVVVADYGDASWKNALQSGNDEPMIETGAIQTAPGFKAELIYTVPKNQQGS